jgi:hypothetical protein
MEQATSAPLHWPPITVAQIFAPGSQVPVQHSEPTVQDSPTNFSVHAGPLPPVPTLPEAPPVAPPVPGEPAPPDAPDAPPPPPEEVPVVMASVLEDPHPMAQIPEPTKATTAPSTSFFTPTSAERVFGYRPG